MSNQPEDLEGNINIGGQNAGAPVVSQNPSSAPEELAQNTLDEPVMETIVFKIIQSP